MILYLKLFNIRKGMNPALPSYAFDGPLIGPVTGLAYRKGDWIVSYGPDEYLLQFTEERDFLRYGGGLYNSFTVESHEYLRDLSGSDHEPIEFHSIDIFSQLNGV